MDDVNGGEQPSRSRRPWQERSGKVESANEMNRVIGFNSS
jgi:hypothetical protein